MMNSDPRDVVSLIWCQADIAASLHLWEWPLAVCQLTLINLRLHKHRKCHVHKSDECWTPKTGNRKCTRQSQETKSESLEQLVTILRKQPGKHAKIDWLRSEYGCHLLAMSKNIRICHVMSVMEPLGEVRVERDPEEELLGFTSNWCWLEKVGVKSWKSFSVVR